MGEQMSGFIQIKKISDLNRLCILPVMVISIFLAFFLYVEMQKIQQKSHELVESAIPHIENAHEGAMTLEHLRRSVDLMTTSVDHKVCRSAFETAEDILQNSTVFTHKSLERSGYALKSELNHLWKMRIQLDEIRSNVHNSAHFMDMIIALITSDNPELFPEFKDQQSDYIDLYKNDSYTRNLYRDHVKYYKILQERLDPKFNVEAFLDQHRKISKALSIAPAQSALKMLDTSAHLDSSEIAKLDNEALNEDGAQESNTQDIRAHESAKTIDDLALAHITGKVTPEANANTPAPINSANNPAMIDQKSVNQKIATIEGLIKSDIDPNFTHEHSKEDSLLGPDELSIMAQTRATRESLYVGMTDKDKARSRTRHNQKMLSYYESELERFEKLWQIYLKTQQYYVSDVNVIVTRLEELSQSFASDEIKAVHLELGEIAYIADESKPMVMVTVGFSLLGMWAILLVISRLIINPLRIIAKILIKFRYTKVVNLASYDDFFKREHLTELREIIDALPQIIEDYSTIKENETELKNRYEELWQNAKYDALTKVFNRGSLNALMKEIGAATPARFAVMMLDIDFFKKLNDTMGHQRGDEVLFAVAQTIQNNLSKKDLVYRYGGEEFCVILSEVNDHNAVRIAQRVCDKVRESNLRHDGNESGIVTISVGLSLVTTSPNQFRIEELLSQADKALYEAKRGGRDRVYVCNQDLAFNDGEQGLDAQDTMVPEAVQEPSSADDSIDATVFNDGDGEPQELMPSMQSHDDSKDKAKDKKKDKSKGKDKAKGDAYMHMHAPFVIDPEEEKQVWDDHSQDPFYIGLDEDEEEVAEDKAEVAPSLKVEEVKEQEFTAASSTQELDDKSAFNSDENIQETAPVANSAMIAEPLESITASGDGELNLSEQGQHAVNAAQDAAAIEQAIAKDPLDSSRVIAATHSNTELKIDENHDDESFATVSASHAHVNIDEHEGLSCPVSFSKSGVIHGHPDDDMFYGGAFDETSDMRQMDAPIDRVKQIESLMRYVVKARLKKEKEHSKSGTSSASDSHSDAIQTGNAVKAEVVSGAKSGAEAVAEGTACAVNLKAMNVQVSSADEQMNGPVQSEFAHLEAPDIKPHIVEKKDGVELSFSASDLAKEKDYKVQSQEAVRKTMEQVMSRIGTSSEKEESDISRTIIEKDGFTEVHITAKPQNTEPSSQQGSNEDNEAK